MATMPHETVLISAPELLIPVLLRRRLCCKLNIVTAFMLVALSILLRSLVFHPRLRGLTFSSPAFSSPVRWSRVFQSCVFHPCILVPSFPVPRFPVPRFQRPRSGPRYDACYGARRAETATGLRRRLARV